MSEPRAAHWVPVAKLEQLAAARRLVLKVRNIELLLLLNAAQQVTALHNRCTHLGKPLDRGRVMAGQITCPSHGACFDLSTGQPVAGPAVLPLHLFPARVVDGDQIEVDMSRLPPTGGWFAVTSPDRSGSS